MSSDSNPESALPPGYGSPIAPHPNYRYDPYYNPPNLAQPTVRRLSDWGTPHPIWNMGDSVMIPLDKPNIWTLGKIVNRKVQFYKPGVDDEVKKLSPAQLSRLEPIYDVFVEPNLRVKKIPERYVVPPSLQERLWMNQSHFKLGEKVAVLLPESPGKMRLSMGFISHITDDHVLHHGGDWLIYPRFYLVYIVGIGNTGYWTKENIQRVSETSYSA